MAQAKRRGRPAKKKTETVSDVTKVEENVSKEVTKTAPVKSKPVTKDKAYFGEALNAIADEMYIAFKQDRALAVRLKSVYNNLKRDASKLMR